MNKYLMEYIGRSLDGDNNVDDDGIKYITEMKFANTPEGLICEINIPRRVNNNLGFSFSETLDRDGFTGALKEIVCLLEKNGVNNG